MHLLTEAQHSMLYRVLVQLCSGNVGGKIVSSWCRNSGPVTCPQDGHQKTPATKAAEAAAPWWEPGDICALAAQGSFLTQEEMVLAQTGWAAYCYPKREVTHNPSGFFLNSFNMPQRSLQIKTGQRLTLEWDLAQIWGGIWPSQSVLPPDMGMKIAAWPWRKRCWLSIQLNLYCETTIPGKQKWSQNPKVVSQKRYLK